MEDIRADSHKLIYHPGRVLEWMKRGDVYPIYAEISPTNACNQNCSFCALSFCRKKTAYLSKQILLKAISEMAKLGVKSIMYAGEGEPLLHPDIEEIVIKTKEAGLDVAITTNGVLADTLNLKKVVPCLSWIRISIDAGTGKSYARIHGCGERAFYRVLDNIKKVSAAKKATGSDCAVGTQMVLLPENKKETYMLAELVKERGADYLIIKGYSEHPNNRINRYRAINYEKHFHLEEGLKKLENARFKVFFRKHSMLKIAKHKEYQKCLGTPFFSRIDSSGDVWPCIGFMGKSEYILGNIYRERFKNIWDGKRRKGIISGSAGMNIEKCRSACRLDEINNYLWKLRHPPEHVNFI